VTTSLVGAGTRDEVQADDGLGTGAARTRALFLPAIVILNALEELVRRDDEA
jgi:hypothetical protein